MNAGRRAPGCGGHLLVSLPAAAYVLFHLVARRDPPSLWGADLLRYYPAWVAVLFVVLPLLLALLPCPSVPARVGGLLRWRVPGPAWALGAASIPLFYLLRDTTHTLGDSQKWFAVIDNALLRHRPFSDIPWHNASLAIPGLEFINYQQPLDLLVHFGAYALGRRCVDASAMAAYAWTSVLAGGLYVVVLWHLAARLTRDGGRRAVLFGLAASLGSIQLFFGYGESYTLVALLSAIYLLWGLDALQRRGGLWRAGGVLLAAAATHMLALSLLPSWLYLAWHDPRTGPWLRRRWVQLPLLLTSLLAAVVVYDRLYRGLHLPLLHADAPGRYPLLSLAHLTTLGNELLLVSPFGALWGLASLVFRPAGGAEPRGGQGQVFTFLGLAALGPVLLIAVHDITMGGRDWDLMSFPALPLALWGYVGLRDLLGPVAPRWVARGVLPVMVLHTLLWVEVNHVDSRAVARLENLLLGRTNQPEHYHQWTLGYYYMEREGRCRDAERAFAAALASAPAAALATPGTRPFSYRKFHAFALSTCGRPAAALAEIRQTYRLQGTPYAGPDDVSLHWEWARSAYTLAARAEAAGDTARARPLWAESLAALTRLARWDPSPRVRHDLVKVRQRAARLR